jgi:nucleotide-binding universal stress UspA family protein
VDRRPAPETKLWREPKAFVESGDAGYRILEQAEELAADLIVLGIRPAFVIAGARTHLGTATANKIVSRANCAVLSVRGKTNVFSPERRRPSFLSTRMS